MSKVVRQQQYNEPSSHVLTVIHPQIPETPSNPHPHPHNYSSHDNDHHRGHHELPGQVGRHGEGGSCSVSLAAVFEETPLGTCPVS